MRRPLENLSHRQRELTPLPFAEWLVERVRVLTGSHSVAALWVRHDSVYFFIPGVECYDITRNARSYTGPYPIIAHPPCGPWGKYAYKSQQSMLDGQLAMRMVERFGGVVEQPVGSSLFQVGEVVNQSDFGHLALKPTKLYWSMGGQ